MEKQMEEEKEITINTTYVKNNKSYIVSCLDERTVVNEVDDSDSTLNFSKPEPLDESILNHLSELSDQENFNIKERIDYILHKIYQTFNLKLGKYSYMKSRFLANLEDDLEYGYQFIQFKNIEYVKDPNETINSNNRMNVILPDPDKAFTDDYHVSLINMFPKYWLFQDFEKELINSKKLFEDKYKDKIPEFNKTDKESDKRSEILYSAASKMTREEKDAVLTISDTNNFKSGKYHAYKYFTDKNGVESKVEEEFTDFATEKHYNLINALETRLTKEEFEAVLKSCSA